MPAQIERKLPYLTKPKGEGYSFIIAVPKALRGRFKSSTGKPLRKIVEGLSTADPKKAGPLAAKRRAHWLQQFERARLEQPLTMGEIEDAAREVYSTTLARMATEAAINPDPDEAIWLSGDRAVRQEALERNDPKPVEYEIEALQRRLGVEIERGTPTCGTLARALLRAHIAAIEGRMRALAGQTSERPATFLGSDGIDPITLRPAPLARPKMRQHDEHGPLAIFEAWVEKRRPAASSVNRWRAVFLDLQSKFGAKEITAQDAQTWADALVSPERSERTVSEVWVNAARTVYGWAAKQKPPLADNPFASVRIEVPEKIETRETLAFTIDEALTILRAASGTEPTSPFNAAKRWVPWLQAYSGARAGEITQLRGQDVRTEAGIPYMLLTPEAGTIKKRKPRSIPLHQHLIDQGFLDFVKSCGSGPLFYDAESKRRRDSKKEGPTSPVRPRAVKTRERLAAWVREQGITDAAVSPTHGWRHLFKQIAGSEDVGISDRISDRITGHAHKSEAAWYGKPTIAQLAQVLAKFPRFEI